MADQLPECKYGRNCYRKNIDHLKRFSHENKKTVQENNKEHDTCEFEPPSKKLRQDLTETTEIITNSQEGSISSTESHQTIKEKFGIDMPQDFYDLWEYCQELRPEKPQDAFKEDLNLKLVGPYDVLAGKQFQTTENKVPCSLHYRYFYDPPEFVTVLKGDDNKGFHIGYYRDNPDEKPVLVASNEAKVNCEFRILGNNIFAGISNYIKNTAKLRKSEDVQGIKQNIEKKAKTKHYPLESDPPSIRKRNKKVVAKPFHKIGIVVPLDEHDVGYRDLQMSNAALKKILTSIINDQQRDQFLDELQDIITRVQFANDECDYGMGLELGLDLFSSGHEMFQKKALMLLSLAYELLGKKLFADIVESHLKCRDEEKLYELLTSS